MNKLTGVEAGRGIAACLVVCMHVRDHLVAGLGPFSASDLFGFGHAGVDFFFVLSGFIILHVHAGDIGRPDRLGHYLQRRFTRVYPFYWVVFLLALLAMGAKHSLPPVPDLIASALLLPLPVVLPVSVAWSLLHEVVFYALFATLIVKHRAGLVLMGTWLALIVADLLRDPTVGLLADVHSVFDGEFFLGMLAAGLLRRARVPCPRTLLLLGAAGFLAVGLAEDLEIVRPLANTTHLGYAVAAMLAVLGTVEAERQGSLRAPRLLAATGGASYAIYLTHLFTVAALWRLLLLSGLTSALPPWIEFAILAAASVGVGWAASRTVERPLMALARRLLAKAGQQSGRRAWPVLARVPDATLDRARAPKADESAGR